MKQTREPAGPALAVAGVTAILIGTSPAAQRCNPRAAGPALRQVQLLMLELFWSANRVPVDRTGPLAWTPSLDGPRFTGSHLRIPGNTSDEDGP